MPTMPDRRARAVAIAVRAAAALTLCLGYADLARGGITAGPLLLVVAYLVLVPALVVTA